MKIGVQLYSLRDYIKENGLETALKTVADAGFDGVELAGFYEKTSDEWKRLLEKYSLTAFSAHIGIGKIDSELTISESLGIRNIIVPWMALDDPTEFEKAVEEMTRLSAELKADGMTLGYHNHTHEFKNGTDKVTELATRISGLALEPDVFWLAVAGVDACAFIEKHSDRISLVHVKELGDSPEAVNPVAGEGRARLKDVLEKSKKTGAEWAVLEIEKTDMPLKEYLTRCCAFMRKHA
ncbi:MAG: sugar phosphate isomerase/epimerase [Clostridiales bacterium]|nr:sugar phosphate isomerase/epimerase [Clostridiales bacterium]